ncbi:septum formation family protein [Ruania alkalisoli]|uniref:Septum formation family protein n=1 Tax=Ruania alkalisoli TaxID=2779775 RepID=A0A7M1ST93_9MICO|nr:septum formation family protein [Ruania alkalisoli]QOR70347.1 septum formation family protein [Ruania alkalisoli]
MPGARARRFWRLPPALLILALATGCSVFDGTDTVSVFDLSTGDCVLAPEDVTVEISEVTVVPCEEPHHLEAYALAEFPQSTGQSTTSAAGSSFPGDAALKDFADGACAEEFADYVGIDYRDSELWFTYLVPSARSWQAEDDRSVLCFVTTTGEELTQSVAGTGW